MRCWPLLSLCLCVCERVWLCVRGTSCPLQLTPARTHPSRYGYEFLYETYLHHIVRADTRHNFSVYFYNLYLVFDSPDMRTTMSRAAFLPQVQRGFVAFCVVAQQPLAASIRPFAHSLTRAATRQLACCIVFGLRFYRDLPLALFLQTIAFVAFNKVCTAQVG